MIKLFITSLIIILGFTGCLTKELPQQTTYTIFSNNDLIEKRDMSSQSIYITKPKTLNSLNSTKIFYTQKPYEFEAYALSKWSDTPAKMIQNALTNQLSNENSYNFVTSTRLKTKATIIINSELIHFQQIIDKEQSYTLLKLRLYLTFNDKTTTKEFNYKTVAIPTAYGAVKAFNQATTQLTSEVSQFVYQTIKEK